MRSACKVAVPKLKNMDTPGCGHHMGEHVADTATQREQHALLLLLHSRHAELLVPKKASAAKVFVDQGAALHVQWFVLAAGPEGRRRDRGPCSTYDAILKKP